MEYNVKEISGKIIYKISNDFEYVRTTLAHAQFLTLLLHKILNKTMVAVTLVYILIMCFNLVQ